MSSSSRQTSSRSFLNNTPTTRPSTVKKDPSDYYKPKPEYKEYAFKPNNAKPEIVDKISSFWKEIDANKLLPPAFIKQDEIEECTRKSDFESITDGEEEPGNNILSDRKWLQTLCLLQKKGLDKVATAAKAKACFFCDDKKYAPIFADEDCADVIRDYGRD